MKSRPLGKTGETIPEIGLGTSGYHGGVEPLRKGISLGAFIGTAEMYGTEDVVGMAVQGFRESTYIASKVLPRNMKYSDLIQAAERSLLLLQTDYIDLYQLHYPNSNVPIAETMRALEDLVDQGKVRFIGVSNRNIEKDLLPYCQQHEITVIAPTPLDRGRLVARSFLSSRQAMDVLEKVADETGRTAPQVALNWCLSRPYVVVIPKSDQI